MPNKCSVHTCERALMSNVDAATMAIIRPGSVLNWSHLL